MLTGDFDLIPSSSVIDLANTLLFGNDVTTDYTITFEDFIDICVQDFDSPSIMKKMQCTLDLDDCGRAKLPCGFNSVIVLVPHCGDIYSQFVYVNRAIFKKMCCEDSLNSDCISYQQSYQIEGNYIFTHNFNGDNTQLDIYYWSLNVDENGLMKIYRTYKTALAI